MKRIVLYLVAISILCFSSIGCRGPKEGCGMDPSIDYKKVDFTKPGKKRGKSELFSKKQRKKMKKRSGN